MSKPDFKRSKLVQGLFRNPEAKCYRDHCFPEGAVLLSELNALAKELGVDDMSITGNHDVTCESLLEIYWDE